MTEECLASGLSLLRIALREDKSFLQSWAAHHAEEVILLGEDAFHAISDEKTPQGVLAEVKIPDQSLKAPKNNCLFLDGVSDPANVGAIIRTAAAAGYEELYLADCADPYAPKSVRASMSGVFYTKLMGGTREEILNILKDIPLIAADMAGEDLFSFHPPERFCLVIGNEGNGLSEVIRTRAQNFVGIPMCGKIESLNAAVSAGIMMYALKQKRKN